MRPWCIAGAVGISSSAIVTKILVEMHRLTNRETRLILGIVVVEDLFLAVYLAALQPVLDESAGCGRRRPVVLEGVRLPGRSSPSSPGTASTVVTRMIGAEQDELLTVCFVGLAVLVAGIAEELHVSDAIGAFMAGLVVAETTVAPRVRKLVLPLRDTFAALFFFTFGLTVDPGDVRVRRRPDRRRDRRHHRRELRRRDHRVRRRRARAGPATNLATTILARGEFSLIIAALGAEAGLDARVVPFVAGYVLVLALGARRSSPRSRRRVARCVPRSGSCANPVSARGSSRRRGRVPAALGSASRASR